VTGEHVDHEAERRENEVEAHHRAAIVVEAAAILEMKKVLDELIRYFFFTMNLRIYFDTRKYKKITALVLLYLIVCFTCRS